MPALNMKLAAYAEKNRHARWIVVFSLSMQRGELSLQDEFSGISYLFFYQMPFETKNDFLSASEQLKWFDNPTWTILWKC